MPETETKDHRSYQPRPAEQARRQDKSLLEEAKDQAHNAGERAAQVASEAGALAKQHPYTTIAITAGLAFAVGALWKMGRARQPSQLDALLARLPDLPSRDSILSRLR